jgi:DNA-binding SARP family transcriptional activator
VEWDQATELLEDREYEQVARLLREQQEAVQRSGQMSLVVMLAAACQLCLTCQQFRREQEIHERAATEAARREEELLDHIHSLLAIFVKQDDIAVDSNHAFSPSKLSVSPPEEELASIPWVRRLIGRLLSGRNADKSTNAMSVSQANRAAIGKAELSSQMETLGSKRKGELPGKTLPAPEQILETNEETLAVVTRLSPSLPERRADEVKASSAKRSTASRDRQPRETNIAAQEETIPEYKTTMVTDLIRKTAASRTITAIQTGDDTHSLAIHCLGTFRVYQNGELVASWNGLKGLSLLKYLAVHSRKPVANEILMDIFWPNMELEAARRNLHQAIYSLRQTLRRGHPNFQYIVFKNECYGFNPQLDLWIDFVEFEQHIRAGKQLERVGRLFEAMTEYATAEKLYEGELLTDDLYEMWPSMRRQELRATYLEFADRLSAFYHKHKQTTTVISLCKKILVQDQCFEPAHRRIMQCYMTKGKRHLAIRQYKSCAQALSSELDLEPSIETKALYKKILDLT